jgi:hypothetical protein
MHAKQPATAVPGATLWGVTTREKVEELLDRLSEAELEAEYRRLREAVEDDGELAALVDEEADELLDELDEQERNASAGPSKA